MCKIASMLFLIVLYFGYSQQHSYNLGECPNVTPMVDFDMSNMLGLWYVIKKTSTSSSCITYNFTRTAEPDTYQLEQTSHTFVPGKHYYHYTGELTVPDVGVPARMKVKFPLNFGSAAYTIFMSDYNNYAAIFTCQKLAFSNRQSVSILSRQKYLETVYLDKIQNKLRTFNINPYDLSIIAQKDCAINEQGTNINVDSETFSAKSIAGVVKKAGEKLGDGIEAVASGVKKLYNGGDTGKKEEEVRTKFTASNTNPDAEWLP